MVEYALILCFPALMAFGAAMDLLTMTIPNRVSVLLVALFVVVAPLTGMSFDDFLMHLAAGGLVLVASFILFAIGGFGGGDAKLLAAGALWVGLDLLVDFLVGVTLLGGALAVLIVLYRTAPIYGLPLPHWAFKLHERGTGIPYGLAISGSALAVFPSSHLLAPAVLGLA